MPFGWSIRQVLAPSLEALNSKGILLQYGGLTASVSFKDVLQRVLATQVRGGECAHCHSLANHYCTTDVPGSNEELIMCVCVFFCRTNVLLGLVVFQPTPAVDLGQVV